MPKTGLYPVPEHVRCACCRRELRVRNFAANPSEPMAEQRVHVQLNESIREWSVLCPCGCYTVSVRRKSAMPSTSNE